MLSPSLFSLHLSGGLKRSFLRALALECSSSCWMSHGGHDGEKKKTRPLCHTDPTSALRLRIVQESTQMNNFILIFKHFVAVVVGRRLL